MSTFITRVELHAANENDYQNLHSAMSRQGFSRTITSDGGDEYHLPTAEYAISGSITIDTVRSRAKTAADSTGKASGVLVTQGNSAWTGLPRVLQPIRR